MYETEIKCLLIGMLQMNSGLTYVSTRQGRIGHQSLGEGGRLPNILITFSQEPYEIKEILVRVGRPLNPPLHGD